MAAKKLVALFALSNVKFGGWVTFTAHLKLGLEALGCEVAVLRVGERTESKGRHWTQGLSYQNVSRARAAELTQIADLSIITCAEAKRAEDTDLLLGCGAVWVVHDPTELKGSAKELPKRSRKPVVVIREIMASHIEAAGGEPLFIPHPYQPDAEMGKGRSRKAISISRMDFDKNTAMLAEANALLGDGDKVAIAGHENRLYTHHKLDANESLNGWRDQVIGEFPGDNPWAGKRMADTAEFVVDLSVIKGDGGGTQYTALEAFDSGALLVMHRDWLVEGDNELQPASFFAHTPEMLAELLGNSDQYITKEVLAHKSKAARGILEAHAADKIAKTYIAIGG